MRELGDVLRVRRLGVVWACGEKRRDRDLGKDSACCGADHLEGLKSPGEELCKKNLQEEQAQNRDQWKPRWKINSLLSEISICWSCTEKITIKIERAFSVISVAASSCHRSFQLSPQLPAVAAASNSHRSKPRI